jgi:Ni/Fe-hydrogenase subunit HybB-like protein
MTRGAFLLTAHGAIAGAWVLASLVGLTGLLSWLAVPAMLIAIGATSYTGFLFAQGLARDLWQGPQAALDLLVQASAEGSAAMLIVAAITGADVSTLRVLAWTLAASSAVHLTILVFENLLTPSPTLHHELAVRAIRHGAYRRLFFVGALGLGGVAPLVLTALSAGLGFSLVMLVPTALVALAGGLAWEYVWVDAGQSVPLS